MLRTKPALPVYHLDSSLKHLLACHSDAVPKLEMGFNTWLMLTVTCT